MLMWDRNINWLPIVGDWGLTLQPRHVPWLGIKPATFCFADDTQPTEPQRSGLFLTHSSNCFRDWPQWHYCEIMASLLHLFYWRSSSLLPSSALPNRAPVSTPPAPRRLLWLCSHEWLLLLPVSSWDPMGYLFHLFTQLYCYWQLTFFFPIRENKRALPHAQK